VGAISGFGIGSIVTPVLATRVGMKVAVAAVALPHFIGTAFRFVLLRKELDRRVLLTFGLASLAGGLAGAVIHVYLASRALAWVLGSLLIFSGLSGLLKVTFRFHRGAAYVAGAFSGLLGGLVGNQGGIRAGALMGFDVRKEAFVATSTAVALLVDGARLPVYLLTEWSQLRKLGPEIGIATVAVLVGTAAGRVLLKRIDEATFRRGVSALILALGVWIVLSGVRRP
jgi:uncharacterized membrane protein YfcA